MTAREILETVVRSQRLGAERRDELARQLRGYVTTGYEQEVAATAEQLGYENVAARLTDAGRRELLAQDARWAAESVVDTFNARMASYAASYQASTRGQVSESDLRDAVKRWAEDYWRQRARVIALTEDAWARGRARLDFLGVNGIEGEARVVPSPYICPVCQSYAAQGWMPLSEAMKLLLPAHVNCPHELEVRAASRATLPAASELWVGGTIRGQRPGQPERGARGTALATAS